MDDVMKIWKYENSPPSRAITTMPAAASSNSGTFPAGNRLCSARRARGTGLSRMTWSRMILSGHGLSSSAAVAPSVHRPANTSRPLTSRTLAKNSWRNRLGVPLRMPAPRPHLQQTHRFGLALAGALRARVPRGVEGEPVDLAEHGGSLVPGDPGWETGIGRGPAPV